MPIKPDIHFIPQDDNPNDFIFEPYEDEDGDDSEE